MKTIIKITKQEAIEAWKKQNNYHNDGEIIVEIIVEIDDVVINELPKWIRGVTPLTTTPQVGEWCQRCGAWRAYGITDNHYCSGYKVTC